MFFFFNIEFYNNLYLFYNKDYCRIIFYNQFRYADVFVSASLNKSIISTNIYVIKI